MSFGFPTASHWACSFLAQADVTAPVDSTNATTASEIASESAEVVELGLPEIALLILSLLILLAFATSLSQWIRLLYHGKRPFGAKAFVPVRPRHLPFWSVLYFVVFIGALIFSSSLLQGAFQAAGWIEKPVAQAAENLSDPQTEPLVATDPVAENSDQTDTPDEDAPDEDAPDEDAPDEDAPHNAEEDNAEEIVAEGSPGLSVPQLTLSTLGMLTATLITLMILCLNHRSAISRIGLIPKRGDIGLGLRSALMILPPTMLIMTAVSLMQEYSHPVLDALQPDESEAGPNYAVFALLFVTTALVTPVVEEFWIRGLLQGGLQRLADWRLSMVRQSFEQSAAPIETPDDDPTFQLQREATNINETAYMAPGTAAGTEPLVATVSTAMHTDSSDWTPTAIWPVFVASLVFALLHWGQGLAPIPLFFLSLGLGYLYRQTGSLIPPIIVHFVLNGLTMLMTLIEMSRA
ncbi:CPBP family intramembrane glutamic endopeptidase [Rhodopirellula baltica]|uniref:CPBP family intramembrane glutamic endopeptidase n=1 Tax=Rhodopirellula baltica TaxID=265606 RepID=UPI001F335EE3|nr:CPBP family intramembrane glutamic endopeptidase [Rhodopirellula baltica]